MQTIMYSSTRKDDDNDQQQQLHTSIDIDKQQLVVAIKSEFVDSKRNIIYKQIIVEYFI